MAPEIAFDTTVAPAERTLVAAFLGDGPFLAATLRNLLGADPARPGKIRVSPLAGDPGDNKVVYRVDVALGTFVLKHARRGFLFHRPRGTFKWREIARMKALDGKGVTPRFGAHLVLRGRDAVTEERIDGMSGRDPRVVHDPARIRELARMWLTISRLLGSCGYLWCVPGSTMGPGNAMFRATGGPPVVVDIGRIRWRRPGTMVKRLVAAHGHADAVLAGIEDALGGAGAKRFFRMAARQVGDETLAAALRARV